LNNPSPKPVIVLGAGGHAKVVAEALIQSGHEILGFVTPDLEPGTVLFGHSVLGDDDVITAFSPDNIMLANGIGALPYQNLRWRLASKMRKQRYNFLTIIHPLAIIASDVVLNDGVQVMAGSVIQPGTKIGQDSIINTGVLLDHDCNIEKNCHLAPGVVCSGGVHVGKSSHLGTGTIVIQSISIGENSIVAAGSVIYKDVLRDVVFMQMHKSKLETNRG